MSDEPSTEAIDLDALRAEIDQVTDGLIDECRDALDVLSPDLGPIADAMRQYCRGGKRMRALFVYAAWRAAYDSTRSPALTHNQVLAAAASLELVQAAALAHDDIIDASDSRRGGPSMHVSFSRLHEQEGWVGDRGEFGRNAAILVGDQLLIWADVALQRADLPAAVFAAVRREFDAMRFEVIAGQYLDVFEQVNPADPDTTEQRALRVAELKAASYTIARPARIGARLAGADEAEISTYATFGHHLGIAFQLRDDVLGVFGDPHVTGKPAGDDLREGKRTVLLARTLQRIDDPALARVGAADLKAAEIDRLRAIIDESGALESVESLIAEHADAAREALQRAHCTAAGAAALAQLTDAAVRRSA